MEDDPFRVVLKAILRVIQSNQHEYKAAPCETCRLVSSLANFPYGCVVMENYDLELKRTLGIRP